MVEYGQYPLVLQLQNGIPVGLAESTGNFSGVNLVVSSISATDYLGFTGSVSFTGVLSVSDASLTGASLVSNADPSRPVIRPLTAGLDDFMAFSVVGSNVQVGWGADPKLSITHGGTGATTDTAARANLGLTIGSQVQGWNNNLDDIAALTPSNNNFIVGDGTDWKSLVPADARTSLGLGSIATVNSPIPVANGGTGATTDTNARSNLGLGTADNPQFNSINIGHASDTTLGRSGAGDLTIEGNVIYRLNGTDVAIADGGTGASTESQARINLGLSALATASSVNLSTQVTNTLPIANGGTGQTTANAALNAILPSQSTNSGKYLKTDGTNTSWDTPAGGGSWTSVFKTADQGVVGTTETDDNTLTFSIDANSKYSFRMQAQFDDSSWGYSFAVSSGINPGLAYSYETFESVSKTVYNDAGQAAATIPTYNVTLAGSQGYGFVRIVGLADNSSGGATAFKFKFCSGSAGKTAYTKAGSHLEYKKL